MNTQPYFALFVKPWKPLSIPEVGAHVRRLGFEWIELPVRPGFAVEPAQIERALSQAVRLLGELGVRVLNVTVALPLDDERLYAACAEAGVGMNRVIFGRHGLPYWEAEAQARRQLDGALPFCERYGVQIGVQHHYGDSLPVNSMGLYNLVKDYNPRHVGAIWDPAHNALQGEDADSGLDMVRSHLCVVNLKNAYWRRVNGPEAEVATWDVYWTSGRQGRASWPAVAAKTKQMGYTGPICFSAEYSAEHDVDRLIVADLAFARSLWG
ncbi:MAG: sugar phosphate isomerase/epimerase [Caldilineaceae bacterium]|nr:sugar phosphate isomerase/epimerase [Caldilineaceae bacterium]